MHSWKTSSSKTTASKLWREDRGHARSHSRPRRRSGHWRLRSQHRMAQTPLGRRRGQLHRPRNSVQRWSNARQPSRKNAKPMGDPKGFPRRRRRRPLSEIRRRHRYSASTPFPFGVVVNKFAQRFYDEGEAIWPKRYAIWGGLIRRAAGSDRLRDRRLKNDRALSSANVQALSGRFSGSARGSDSTSILAPSRTRSTSTIAQPPAKSNSAWKLRTETEPVESLRRKATGQSRSTSHPTTDFPSGRGSHSHTWAWPWTMLRAC